MRARYYGGGTTKDPPLTERGDFRFHSMFHRSRRFVQQFSAASLSNNYRRPVIGGDCLHQGHLSASLIALHPRPGYAEDVERVGRREIESFFNRYYGPANITVAIAGDVKPEEVGSLKLFFLCAPLHSTSHQVRTLAEANFGGWNPRAYERLPAGQLLVASSGAEGLPRPGSFLLDPSVPVVRETSEAGPLCLLGFYRPALTGPDSIALEVSARIPASVRRHMVCHFLALFCSEKSRS